MIGLVLGAVVLLACGINPRQTRVADTSFVLGAVGDRLGQAAEVTYSAEYGLAGIGRITLAQSPPEAAVLGPRGRFVVTRDHLLRCDARGCERAPNRNLRLGRDTAGLADSVLGAPLPSADVVLGVVATAAVAPGARAASTTKQYAGRDTECAEVTGLGAGDFVVCLTPENLLAFYRGPLPDGRTAEIELLGLRRSVDAADLGPPTGATITDVAALTR